MSTRAIKFLQQKAASFEIVKYKHDRKGAVFAAQSVGFPLERTVKTLVVMLGQKQFVLALVPGDRQLNLKEMAKACKVKRAEMADTAVAERLTGYQVGGISPFGTRTTMPVYAQASIFELDRICINGGRRDMLVELDPAELVRILGASAVDAVQA